MKMIFREIMVMFFVVFGVYLLIGVGVLIKQRDFMYMPPSRMVNVDDAGIEGLVETYTETVDGLRLRNWYLPPLDIDGDIIVFFHGNASDLLGASQNMATYVSAGYGVFLVGYRGYNGNEGSPTEEGLYDDARAALEFLKAEGFSEERIILYGQSLGTGVAVRMASECEGCDALILESPYTSMAAVAQYHYWYFPANIMTFDRYDSYLLMADIRLPVFILHAARDWVVPTPMGREMLDIALGRDGDMVAEGHFIEGGTHNTMGTIQNQRMVMDFLESLDD